MAAKRRYDGMPRVTLKDIHRLEVDGWGWHITVTRHQRSHSHYFRDGVDGPFASLLAAIVWRDDAWRAGGPPRHARTRGGKPTTTGAVGVIREVVKQEGRVYEKYRAGWYDEANQSQRRSFSIDKYGEQKALRLAVEARRAGVAAADKARRQQLLDVVHMHRTLLAPEAASALAYTQWAAKVQTYPIFPKSRKRLPPRVTLKNVNRIEKSAHGWRVHIKRQRREYVQYFPDAMDGPFQSLRDAIAWRDEMWRTLGIPYQVRSVATTRSSTGVLGVTREVQLKSRLIFEGYRAAWTDETKHVRKRSFSIDKFGEQPAKEMAIAARRAGVAAAEQAKQRRLLDVLNMHREIVEKETCTCRSNHL